MACSYDGTVLYVKLTQKEIGKQLSPTQQTSYLTKSFGSDSRFIAEHPSHLIQPNLPPPSLNENNNFFSSPSSTSILSHNRNSLFSSLPSSNSSLPSSLPKSVAPSNTAKTLQNQQETVKDGKRRIRPQLVSQNNFEMPPPSLFPPVFTQQSDNSFQNSLNQNSEPLPTSFHLPSFSFSSNNDNRESTENNILEDGNDQINKNIQNNSPPISFESTLPVEEKKESSEEDSSVGLNSSSESSKSSKKKKPKRTIEENPKKKTPPPKKSKTTNNKSNKNEKSSKRKESLDSNKKKDSNNKKESNKRKSTSNESSQQNLSRPLIFDPKKIVPYHNFEFVSPFLGKNDKDNPLSQILKIEIVNSDSSKYKLTATNKGRVFWNLEQEGNVSCFSFNSHHLSLVVQTENNESLCIFDHFGKILFPSFALEHAVHQIISSSHSPHTLLLCCDGSLFFWDFSKGSLIFSNNISHLISEKSKLEKMWIAPNSVVVLCFSNGNSYCHSLDLKMWVRVDDLQFTKSSFFTSSSHKFRQENMNNKQDAPQFVLSKIQTDSFILREKTESFFSRGYNFDSKETLSHIEHQMASSLSVRSFVEYSQWSKIYLQKLSEADDKDRIYFFCDSLINAPESDQYKNHKKQLLKDCLNLIKQYDITEFYKNLLIKNF